MNAETIQEYLRRKPFEPFEVQLSSGQTHQVGHPEFAFVLGSRLVVGYTGTNRVADLSLIHVTRVTTLQSA
jgi:hypothetical protein